MLGFSLCVDISSLKLVDVILQVSVVFLVHFDVSFVFLINLLILLFSLFELSELFIEFFKLLLRSIFLLSLLLQFLNNTFCLLLGLLKSLTQLRIDLIRQFLLLFGNDSIKIVDLSTHLLSGLLSEHPLRLNYFFSYFDGILRGLQALHKILNQLFLLGWWLLLLDGLQLVLCGLKVIIIVIQLSLDIVVREVHS